MVWIILTLILIVFGVLTLVNYFINGKNTKTERKINAERSAYEEYEKPTDGALTARFLPAAFVGLAIVWFVIITPLIMYHKVPENHVGIVYGIGGEIVGDVPEGVQWIAPYRTMGTESLQVKKYAPEEAFTAGSQEDLAVSALVVLNYRVNGENVQALWSDVGRDWFDILVPQRLTNILKQEFKRFPVLEITANRQVIIDRTVERLQEALDVFSITIVRLDLTDIDFSDAINAAISSKQEAEQRALTERNLIKLEEARKERVIIEAEGQKAVTILAAEAQAETTRIEAEGIADANATIGDSINPQLLQWRAIQAMETIDFALLPAGEGLIIDPTSFLTGVREAVPPEVVVPGQ